MIGHQRVEKLFELVQQLHHQSFQNGFNQSYFNPVKVDRAQSNIPVKVNRAQSNHTVPDQTFQSNEMRSRSVSAAPPPSFFQQI